MSSAYREAAGVLDLVLTRKRGIRTAALADGVKRKKQTVALVSRTLECKDELEAAVASVAGAEKALKKAVPGRAMRLLMLYDLLLGRGKIAGGGKASRAVKELAEPLAAAIAPVKARRDAEAAAAAESAAEAGSLGCMPPRYVRVNTLKSKDLGAAQAALCEAVAEQVLNSARAGAAEPTGSAGVAVDPHVHALLACPAGIELHAHEAVEEGGWILQDKASCFSAEALVDGQRGALWKGRGDVIDACAAPGNKTTHLAALLQNSGCKVVALDRDPQRLATLKSRVKQAGAHKIVRAMEADFLALDVHSAEVSGVRSILLDPSCSGSGIKNGVSGRVVRWVGGRAGAGLAVGAGGVSVCVRTRARVSVLGSRRPCSRQTPPHLSMRFLTFQHRSWTGWRTRARRTSG